MFMNKKKLKLSIIISIIINSTCSYALNDPSELVSTKNIEFNFESVDKDSLLRYDSNRQIHGRMFPRNLPTILASKYNNIIITSDKYNTNISHDIGKTFNSLKIKDFNNISALSLSEDGHYLTAHGEYNNNSVFFVYDVFLKEIKLFNHKDDISYYIEDDYYFTTNDGLFSLYSEDNDPYARYTSPREKKFFIFDNENKKSISLSEWNKTKINNHIEKNKFILFEDLAFINKLIKLKPNITAPSFSGKYLYGTLQRENQESKSVRLAFIYDKSNDDVKIISDSDYGSSKINQFSKNDLAVGWIESRIKRRNESNDRLIREAFIYDPTKNKIRKPIINNTGYDRYYNSEATAISENGEFFVGWVEYGNNIINKTSPLSKYLRNAFIYFVEENKSQLLLNLNNDIKESEAHSISKDGNTVFGISKDIDSTWRMVAWNLGRKTEQEIEKNQRKEAINIKFDTLLANNDIKKVTDNSNLLLEKIALLKENINTQREELLNKLETTKNEMHKANKERVRIENIIDKGEENGDQDIFNRYSDEYHRNKYKEEEYQKNVEDLNTKIANFDKGEQSTELKLTEYEYEKSKTTLNALTQKNATIEVDKKQRLDDEAKAEQERLAKEQADKTKAEQERIAKEQADKAKAEQERLAKEQADKTKAEQERLAKEQADKTKAEQERLAKEQADKAKAEQERLAKEQADKTKAEQERLAKEQADKTKAEQERLAKDQADKAKAEQERLAKEQADKTKAEQERLAKEQADKVKAEQERLAKEQADKAKAEQERLAKEQADIKAKEKEKEITKPSIIISKPIDIENTYKSMQLMAENGYKFMDMQQGQLRYLASATCSVGAENACISGFTHYQNLNKTNATQTGLSGAYRFDIKNIPLVVGLAIDTDVSSSLPKGYQYQGYALPLIGFSLDLIPSLNAELNNNAPHFSLKGAYLNRKVSIERPALAGTESGKGNARISGYHIDFQTYYPYSLSDNLLLTSFVGITFNQISRSAYSETQNAQFAAHYDALKTHSLFAKMGLGMEHLLGSSFILNTKAGLLWNLSHYQGDFRSHIDYLGQQQIDYSENKKQVKQRPFANVGITYQFDKQSSVNTSVNWEMTTYRNHDMQIGVSYTYRF
ncbi:autotransporter domain-containing protein [Proteus terrae]|uniref:autotransporter domain-containing protein n=2 Tax=Proteus terrae TaxID=1574161 RepID=UPI001D0227CC|nr:autotransporter domain-containing protein [Proteus terrae]UDF25464.1 autotransporter domain-containing protein [Proteus terrae subsp. cibarius]WCG86379.1 autotransporter domain-containing protein [Proteus terrae]